MYVYATEHFIRHIYNVQFLYEKKLSDIVVLPFLTMQQLDKVIKFSGKTLH